MTNLNKILQQQIEQYLKDTDHIPEQFKTLLDVISATYNRFEPGGQQIDPAQKNDRSSELQCKEKEHLEISQQAAHIGSWELSFPLITEPGREGWYASDEVYRILGYEPGKQKINEELFFARVHPDDRDLVRDAFKKTIYTVSDHDTVHRIVMPDGTEKIIREQARMIMDDKTKMPVKLIGTMQDITEQKRSEELLKNAYTEITSLLERINEVFFVMDMEQYRCTHISMASEKVYGHKPEEFYQNPNLWFDLIHDEDKPMISDNKKLLEQGEHIVQEYRIHDKSGDLRWLESKLEPTLNSQGKLIRIDGVTTDITARQKAKLAVKNNLYTFKALIENSSDAITLINDQYEVVFASDSMKRVTGFTADEVSGKTFADFVHPDDASEAGNFFEALKKTQGIPLKVVFRTRKKDGTYIWCERIATNLLHDPAIKGIIQNYRDITEKKIATELLEQANRELSTLFENMEEVFFSVDVERQQLLQITNACEKIYGYTMHEFLNTPNLWFILIIPDDKQLLQDQQQKLNKGLSAISQYCVRHKNGSIKWVETRIKPTLGKDGNLIRLDGFTSDITRRKETEIALQNSEHKFRSLIQHAADAVTVKDEQGRILFASESLKKVKGFVPEEVVGTLCFDYIHPEDLPLFREFYQRVLSNPGQTFMITSRERTKSGKYIWCERITTNLLNDPAINGVVCNLRDITEQQEYGKALETSNEELKKTNMELDRFVYSASHDLRAPLSSMLGLLYIMETETDPKDLQEDMDLLKGSIKKLDSFIIDIIDYSKNSRLTVKKEAIKFREQIGDVINNLKFMGAGNVNVDIRMSIDNAVPFYSDKNRINVILNNLISNAIRYSDPGQKKPYVEIGIKTSVASAEIRVKDNGIGIPRENHQQVFDMFFRLSKHSVGSGLGLYIVKETVQKLQGTIRLESEPGKGTEIIISIPNIDNHPA